MNGEKIPIQINMDDVSEMLRERDLQILQLRSALRQTSEQITNLKAENDQMRKDLEKQNKLKVIKKEDPK